MSKFKNAFTLVEIMIVLTVIGVLTAILLPVAFQAAPDENVLKFKKANTTLGTIIRELVNSDRYFQDGDLGTKYDGTLLVGISEEDKESNKQYFCNSFADLISAKEVNCTGDGGYTNEGYVESTHGGNWDGDYNYEGAKNAIDSHCQEAQKQTASYIISADNIVWFEANPAFTFGNDSCGGGGGGNPNSRCFAGPNDKPVTHRDKFGFPRLYKVFCIDVDGLNNGENPFGYGIRADGKILYGKKADEWMKKAVQQSEEAED